MPFGFTHSSSRRVHCAVLASAVLLVATTTVYPSIASAQSAWDQLKAQAKKAKDQLAKPAAQPGAQPAAQPGTQPGQPQGAKPGQPQRAKPGQTAALPGDSGPFTPPPGTAIDPVVAGPYSQGELISISPHRMHVTMATNSGSRWVMLYDGASSQKFDRLIYGGNGSGAVFSPDGEHWAYCGYQGNEWMVFEDGRELSRGQTIIGQVGNQVPATGYCEMHFTSNSKHMYFTTAKERNASSVDYILVWDGKAGPAGYGPGDGLRLSPDGNHVAYMWNPPTATIPTGQFVIDSQLAPYTTGGFIQFTGDGQHIFSQRVPNAPGSHVASVWEAMLDGKPFIRADQLRTFVPPTGLMAITVLTKNANPQSRALAIGGKLVPGSELVGGNYSNVIFSPDGKHYAAIAASGSGRHWVFADGKKQLEYGWLGGSGGSEVFYTADSSKLIYEAGNDANPQWLIINGEESESAPQMTAPVLAPVGNHVLASSHAHMIFDGKFLPMPGIDMTISGASAISFSPDGNHYAFVLQNRNGRLMFIDGVQVPGYTVSNTGGLVSDGSRAYVWSPDSKHVGFLCRSADPAAPNDTFVCLDNKAVCLGPTNTYTNLAFSGDSNHLFWTKGEPQGAFRVFVDGKPVYEGHIPVPSLGSLPWEAQPDGTLRFLSVDQTNLVRVSITPSSSTSISTLFGGN